MLGLRASSNGVVRFRVLRVFLAVITTAALRPHHAFAQPGSYRLVAVDKIGNRSDPTQPVVIRVGSPTTPKPAAPMLQFVAAPFPHIALQFQEPPAGLNAIVERQDQPNGGWLRITGPMQAALASDNNPAPTGKATYRISYVSADGKVGPPSDIANAPTFSAGQR